MKSEKWHRSVVTAMKRLLRIVIISGAIGIAMGIAVGMAAGAGGEQVYGDAGGGGGGEKEGAGEKGGEGRGVGKGDKGGKKEKGRKEGGHRGFYLEGVEEFVCAKPTFKVRRPSREWFFLDLEALKRSELEEAWSELTREKIREKYRLLRCRLWNGALKASFSVLTDGVVGDIPSMETMVENIRRSLKEGPVKCKILRLGPFRLRGREVLRCDYVTLPQKGDRSYHCSRIEFVRSTDRTAFILYLEVAREHRKTAVKAFQKILHSFRF